MRLIDADAFADFIAEVIKRQRYDEVKLGSTLTIADVLDAVIAELKGEGLNGFNNAPTIEPERKTGKWENGCICSVCGERCDYHLSGDIWIEELANFCPNCGAKMEREQKHLGNKSDLVILDEVKGE